MTELFSENFLISKTDEDLDNLQAQYPTYDRYYIASGSISDRKKFFNEMYEKFKPYADSHFLIEAKTNFHQRVWEMYMACVLIKNGLTIVSNNKGPDIKLVIGGKTVWIECVAPKKGEKDNENSVPDIKYGVVQDLPEKQMLFRLRNSLDEKFKVYEKYLSDGIVKKDDIFIIAINRASLDHTDPGIPLIFKALFSIGFLSFPIKKLKEEGNSKFGKPSWTLRSVVPKGNGSEVSMNFFQNPNHAGISAVIYSKNSVLSCRAKTGEECVLTHNPLATNPLSEQVFPFFEQYRATDDKIIKI